MLVLLSNDDGINSEGLQALKVALQGTDDVWVVGPDSERTCIGHAITLHKPLRIHKLNHRTFSTNGTPADSVLLALRVLLPRKPDLVISGINKGPNMGQDVSYSGTVAAAKEGAFAGIISLAVSLNARSDFLFDAACRAVVEIVQTVREGRLPPQTLLNINIPNIPYEKNKGIRVTRLGKRIYNGNIIERIDPRGGPYYWIGGDGEAFEAVEGTDLHAVDLGYISVTPLHWDLTSHESISHFSTIFPGGHYENHAIDP